MVASKPDSMEPPAAADALVGDREFDRGCESTTSSRCQIIGGGGGAGDNIGKNQVSATIPAAASNAAGAGGDESSASASLERKELRQTRSSDVQARYSASAGADACGDSGTSRGSGSSGEDHPVLLRRGKQKDEGSWSGKTVALAGRLLSTSVTSTKVGTQGGDSRGAV